MGLKLFAQIIPDDNFRERINVYLGQPPDYEPTIADLNSLTGSLSANFASILSIEGAQYLTNITDLSFHVNQISDISALSGLTNLTELSFYVNQISDISALSDLTNLTRLNLHANQINDISALSDLTNLERLFISQNQISDITALSGLTNLTRLSSSCNQISDISALSELTNLEILSLYGNQISDISPLYGLTNLDGLDLDSNQISDIPALSGLTNLTWLYLSDNQLSDISALSGLTNIHELSLHDNQLSDISALSGLTNIYELYLYDNQITDISPLVENSGLGSGDYLYISYIYSQPRNPLSLEAIEVHIPILQSRGFYEFYFSYVANTNAACYPSPIRHAENVSYNCDLYWQGAESSTSYEVYLGTSNENLISIGEGLYISDSTFTISPVLLPDTEYWWRVKSTTEREELWSGMWHFTTEEIVTLNDETVELFNTLSNYPNPFNPKTNIQFDISENETGTLSIYNIKGQLIESKQFESGQHTYIWDASNQSSGVYLYKLNVNDKMEAVKKCLLLK